MKNNPIVVRIYLTERKFFVLSPPRWSIVGRGDWFSLKSAQIEERKSNLASAHADV